MKEVEWQTCTEPMRMLDFLGGAVDDRKLRLFGVACVRALPEYVDARSGVWQGDGSAYRQRYNRQPVYAGILNARRMQRDMFLHSDRHMRPGRGYLKGVQTLVRAVAAAELFADGRATLKELNAAHAAALKVGDCVREMDSHEGEQLFACAAAEVTHPSAYDAALAARRGLVEIANKAADVDKEFPDDLKSQCTNIRELVGNPFGDTPTVRPAASPLDNRVIPDLAQSIYDKRSFDQLPTLADILEKAGCTNPEILAHCRQPGHHYRGCWVLDLLLGKNSFMRDALWDWT
jgi:hypothetical protein